VVWQDSTLGGNDIYFRKSIDDGRSFQTTKRLTYTVGESLNPEITISGSMVYVVYDDDTSGNIDIYLKYSPL